MKPWNAEHAAGRITRPLRHNGIPYKGINVLMLWSAAVTKGYACPIWITFKQALELGGNVRKGEHGELVVYADRITRTETDDKGEETEREIPFLKGYTVFNVEQCEGLPAHYYAKAEPPALSRAAADRSRRPVLRRDRRRHPPRRHPRLLRRRPRLRADAAVRDVPRRRELRRHARARTDPLDEAREAPGPRSRARSAGATKATPARNWSPNWAPPSSAPISASHPRCARITPPTSRHG